MRSNNKKRTSTGFWGDVVNRLPLVGTFLLMSVLTGSMFFNKDGISAYFEMRHTHSRLEAQLLQLQALNASLKKDITRIQQDPQRLEELARNRLGMVRQGEIVYQFVEEPTPSSMTARP